MSGGQYQGRFISISLVKYMIYILYICCDSGQKRDHSSIWCRARGGLPPGQSGECCQVSTAIPEAR